MNNVLILAGRITKELELKATKDKNVCEVNLAIQNGKDDTTFISVVTFGKVAETISKYCKKGDMVGFQCIVKNHNWTDKNNNKHYDYTFIANKMNFLGSKKETTNETKESSNPYLDFANSISLDNEDLAF